MGSHAPSVGGALALRLRDKPEAKSSLQNAPIKIPQNYTDAEKARLTLSPRNSCSRSGCHTGQVFHREFGRASTGYAVLRHAEQYRLVLRIAHTLPAIWRLSRTLASLPRPRPLQFHVERHIFYGHFRARLRKRGFDPDQGQLRHYEMRLEEAERNRALSVIRRTRSVLNGTADDPFRRPPM